MTVLGPEESTGPDEDAVTLDVEADQSSEKRPHLVGIGASAGGLDAIIRFLESVPADSVASFAIVQHLDPTHDSALATILGRKTSLQVEQITDVTPVEASSVYVIPPGKYLSVRDGVLQLTEPTESRGSRMAIDHFFRSLAHDYAERAVGIIFSGTGADGTAGLREIKEYGGLTCVQDPDEAEHPGMPRSAIEADAADCVLPVTEIARRLQRYLDFAHDHGQVEARASMDSADDIEPVIAVLRDNVQQDFSRYRKSTLNRRIRRRMGIHQLSNVKDYVHLLKDSQQELRRLRCDLLIGVTRFFRNPDAWDRLNELVIRPLCASGRERPIRVWSAGCATGEEAYSIAMLLHETLGVSGGSPHVQVFASDVADDGLQIARAGYYPAAIESDVSTARLRRFFKREGDRYRVSRTLRESIVFAEQNVLAHPPFTKLDLIICRNLMIYLENEAQRRVMEVFRFALNEGGALFLGSSESVRSGSEAFLPIDKQHRLFRRTGTSALPPVVDRQEKATTPARVPIEAEEQRPKGLATLVQRQLLQELEEGVVVINHEDRVTHLQGRTDLYLELRVGDVVAELPLLTELAREGLKGSVRSIVKATRNSGDVETTTARVRRDGAYHRAELVARPLRGAEGSVLLTFRPQSETPAPSLIDSPVEKAEASDSTPSDQEQARQHVLELEQELSSTRQQLSSTIEDLETANEELKASNEESLAINEELHSGNEELETSKEELQSLNEELTTLNNQLEIKVKELVETTDDLNNLLVSTSLPTIFVDSGLVLRRFTPSSQELFRLIDSDIGRPLNDLRAHFKTEGLFRDIGAVLDDLQPREREVTTESGNTYIARSHPYRTEHDRIQGAVLTFADVTKLRKSKRLAQDRLAELRSIYAATPIGLAFVDTDLRYRNVSQVMADIDGVAVEESVGKRIAEVLPPPLFETVSEIYRRVLDTCEPETDVEIVGQTAADEEPRIYTASYHPVRCDDGDAIGVSVVVQDVTDERSYQERLAESEKRFRSTFENAAVGIAHVGVDGKWLRANDRLCEILGYERRHLTDRTFQQITHPDDLQEDLDLVQEMLDGKRTSYSMEKRYVRGDGSTVWALLTVSLVRTEAGEPEYFILAVEDISSRRQTEDELRESELRFRQLASVTDHVFWVTQVEPEEGLYISEAYERIWGRKIDELKADPRLWLEAIHQDDREAVTTQYGRFVDDPKQHVFDVEYRVVRPDGEVRWIADRGDAVFNREGVLERVAGIARDVTEKKQSELDLHAAKLRIDAFMRNVPSAMGLLEVPEDDADAYVLLSNPVTDLSLRLEPGESSGKWARGDLRVDDSHVRQWVARCRESQQASDPVHFELRVDRTNEPNAAARQRWISVSVSHVGPGAEGREQFCYVATDVTGRKRHEIDLADRESHVRRIIDNVLSFVGVLTTDGTLVEVNEAAIVAGGVPREEVIGKKFWDCYWWSYDEAVAQRLREAVESALKGETVRYDATVRMADDTRMVIDFMLVPARDDHGEVTHLIPSGVDITERNAAEEGLRRSHDAFLGLVKRMPFGLYLVDSDLRLLQLSEGAKAAFESVKDPIGRKLDEIMTTLWPSDVAAEIVEHFRDTLRTGEPYHGTVDAQKRANIDRVESYDWTIYHTELPEGGLGVACYYYDTTPLKEIERALRRSEMRLRLATDVSGIGVLSVDFRDHTVKADQVAAEYYDLDADRKHSLDELFERIPDEDLGGSNREAWDRAVAAGEDFEIAFEHRLVDRAGGVRWLGVRERVFGKPDDSGVWRPRTAIAASIDITERRRFELSLVEARDVANAANRSRGEFLANMSHEIRTPMAAVIGHADMLLDHLKDPDNVDAVATIKRNGAHLLEIINDILDLSKIEAGKFEIDRQECKLGHLLRDIETLREIKAKGRPIEFRIVGEGPLPRTIHTDPTRLKQILFNLVGNALKFTSEGWVELRIALVDSDEPAVRFTVEDTGIGISDEKVQTLFEPFAQGDASVTREFGGTGLGLAISRRLAELLGATLEASSVLGKGSTFTLTVPAGEIDRAALKELDLAVAESAAPAPIGDAKLACRLLLVDDRRDIRYVAQHFLEDAGATVTTAEDGEQAINAVEQAAASGEPFDIIIMDMQMPNVDGYTAVERLRKAGLETPIIALTANAMKSDRDQCLAAGCTDYLPKPIDADRLIGMVAQLTGGEVGL